MGDCLFLSVQGIHCGAVAPWGPPRAVSPPSDAGGGCRLSSSISISRRQGC